MDARCLRSYAALLLLLGACQDAGLREKPATAVRNETPVETPRASFELAPLKVERPVRWVALGGGADPLSNQVSLAQDLEILRGLLPTPGVLLFASGPGANLAVSSPVPDDMRLESLLAGLFGSPGAVSTRYAPATFPIDGPSTAEQVRAVLRQALEPDSDPLLVYAACHGEGGETPLQSALSLWGGWSFAVTDLIDVLDDVATPRPAQFVITSCFGGGFAELIFKQNGELRSTEQCGVFAAPWDREASGCDPNPDRRAQESYALHLLAALRGQDREGREQRQRIDLDGDGQIGLLEAHTFARIAARSLDMPTTTSERFLRAVVKPHRKLRASALAPSNASETREEQAVVEILGQELELGDEAAALAKLKELEDIVGELGREIERAQQDEDESFYALRIALFERWPLLDHPWEARTQEMLRREGSAIQAVLLDSEAANAHRQAQGELDELLTQQDHARVAHARVARLARAHETVRLARALEKSGGEDWKRYQALHACERRTPLRMY